MMRPSRSRPALAVVLTLALLATLTLGVGAAMANSAQPADSARLAIDDLTIGQAAVGSGLDGGAAVGRLAEGPTGRFAFSVLDQGSTSVSKTITSVNGVAQPAGTTNVNAAQGNAITFQIVASNIQTGFVRDFLSPNFTFTSASVACVPAPAAGQQGIVPPPSGSPQGTTVLDCHVQNSSTGSTFTINATVSAPAGSLPLTDPAANVVCAGQVAATGSQTAQPGVCSLPMQVGIQASGLTSTPTPTGTPAPTSTAAPTATATPTAPSTQTIATAVALLPRTGTTPCATQIGQQCTVTGTLAGSFGTKTGSMTWTIIVPGGLIPVGSVATVVIQTTVNPAGEVLIGATGPACPVATAAQVTCTGTTVGDGLIGGTIAVIAPSGMPVATGTIVGAAPLPGPPVIAPGAAGVVEIPRVAIPAVPAPPVQFIPPAPAPLLPPVGPLPPLQGSAPPVPPAYPEIPVIPEADTLPLLFAGLAALGAYAAWRRWRGGE